MRHLGFLTRSAHRPHALGSVVRAWVWALLALILLASLAPAISRTLDHGKPLHQRGWLEVCSARGQVWVQTGVAGDLQAPLDQGLTQHLDACAYCVLGTDRGTPPPNFDGWGRSPSVAPPCPAWAGHRTHTAHVHLPLARGPPTST
jgi:Protein of unknown function (DUF2946)